MKVKEVCKTDVSLKQCSCSVCSEIAHSFGLRRKHKTYNSRFWTDTFLFVWFYLRNRWPAMMRWWVQTAKVCARLSGETWG